MPETIAPKTIRPFWGRVTAPLPTVTELAWAAGLFEGEGSIGFGTRRSQAHALTPKASLTMTDQDVIERFREAVGFGTVKALAPPRNWKEHYKQPWRWQGYGPNVLALATAFLPWLGERRSSQVANIRQEYEASRIPEEKLCAGCGKSYRPTSRYTGRTQIYCELRCGVRARSRVA